MEASQQTDAKAATATGPDAGLSSIPHGLNDSPSPRGDIINTVDDDSVKAGGRAPAQDAEDKGEGQPPDKGGEAGDKTGTKGQEGRYDQHPDWQRMKTERDEALQRIARLEGILEGKGMKPGETPGPEKSYLPQEAGKAPADLPYKDITKMSKEELIEWFEDDPVGYEANRFAQFLSETKMILAKEAETKGRVKSISDTFSTYEKNNPDFKKMWDSGEIERFMQDNPGHNAMSAHMAMTADKRLQAAIEKATKDAEEKVRKDFQAKREASTVGAGQAGASPRADGAKGEELTNIKDQGGLVSAIASRLQRMRHSGG